MHRDIGHPHADMCSHSATWLTTSTGTIDLTPSPRHAASRGVAAKDQIVSWRTALVVAMPLFRTGVLLQKAASAFESPRRIEADFGDVQPVSTARTQMLQLR